MSPEMATVKAALEVVEKLERERDDAQCEVTKLAKQNDELCDELDDLRNRIAEIGVKYAALQAAQEGRAA